MFIHLRTHLPCTDTLPNTTWGIQSSRLKYKNPNVKCHNARLAPKMLAFHKVSRSSDETPCRLSRQGSFRSRQYIPRNSSCLTQKWGMPMASGQFGTISSAAGYTITLCALQILYKPTSESWHLGVWLATVTEWSFKGAIQAVCCDISIPCRGSIGIDLYPAAMIQSMPAYAWSSQQ